MTHDLQRLLPLLPRGSQPGTTDRDVADALRIGRRAADSLLKAAQRLGLAVFAHPKQHGRRLGGWRAA